MNKKIAFLMVFILCSGCEQKNTDSFASKEAATANNQQSTLSDDNVGSDNETNGVNSEITEASITVDSAHNVNDEGTYRKLMFEDIPTKGKVIFVGKVIQVFNEHGTDAALVATESQNRSSGSIYDMVISKPEFSGRNVVVAFSGKARVLEDDYIAVKGGFAGIYEYQNRDDETIKIPMISGYFYKGSRSLNEINDFLMTDEDRQKQAAKAHQKQMIQEKAEQDKARALDQQKQEDKEFEENKKTLKILEAEAYEKRKEASKLWYMLPNLPHSVYKAPDYTDLQWYNSTYPKCASNETKHVSAIDENKCLIAEYDMRIDYLKTFSSEE